MNTDNLFTEIATGRVNNRNQIIPYSELPHFVKLAQNKMEELYSSYYLFDESMVKHVEKTGSVTGYTGKYHLNRAVLDIDKGANTDEETLSRARSLVAYLLDSLCIPDNYIRPYFSGRGFHIELPNIWGVRASKTLPSIIQSVCKELFPTVDDVFDATRIIRVPQTINAKSGRFKIPLLVDEMERLRPPAILDLSKHPREAVTFEAIDNPEPLLSSTIKKDSPAKPFKGHIGPSRYAETIREILEQGEVVGSRHRDAARLAGAFRFSGTPLAVARANVISWAKTLHEELPDEVERIVKYAYRDTEQEEKRIYYSPVEVRDAKAMEEAFQEFASTDFSRSSFDLGTIYPSVGTYRCYPGEFILLMGDTGLGKTALAQHICTKLPEHRIIYFSLEVDERLVFRRFIQILHKMKRDEVFDYYKANKNSLSEEMSHIQVVTDAPDLFGINRIISEQKPTIVVVDVTDAVSAGGDELGREVTIANGLKRIAIKNNTIVIGIHHISKAAAYMPRLTVHSGKGSSAFEQKADKVIGVEGVQSNPLRKVTSLKARDEGSFSIMLNMDFETFCFDEVKGVKV